MRTSVTNAELVGGLPQVSVIGTPRAIGEALGQRLKARLHVLAEYLLENLAQNSALTHRAKTPDQIRALIAPAAANLAALEPSLAMELESCSRTSGLALEDLLVIHGYSDLQAYLGSTEPATPSTFVAVPANQTVMGTPLQVLVWECDPVLIPYVTLVHRIPAHGPASLSLTLAGMHTVAFLNEAGLAVASNALVVTDPAQGYFTTHLVAAMTTAPGFSDAVSRSRRGPRWGGRAIHMLTADGSRESVELSGKETSVLSDPNQTVPRVHTNHALSEAIKPLTADDPFSRLRLEHVAMAAIRARRIEPPQVFSWFGLDIDSTTYERPTANDTTTRRKRGLVANPDGCITLVLDPAQRCVYLRKGRNAPLERKML